MFYDKRLMCSKSLGVVWKAANMNISDENEVNVPKVCKKLRKWINSDEQDVKRRFSLRTSATFLGGVVKLYKRGVQQMLEDTYKLDKEMSRKRRRFEYTSETELSNRSTTSSSSVTTPALILDMHRSNSRELSPILPTRRKRLLNSTSSQASRFDEYSDTTDDNNNTNSNSETSIEMIATKDKGVQTLFHNSQKTSFNENLSFAYIFVHDNNKSKMPSRMILSSINPEMRNLM